MAVWGNPGGRGKPAGLRFQHYEGCDDSGRHNDPSDKDRPAHKGGGRSAAMLGIKHGGLLCGNHSRLGVFPYTREVIVKGA